MTYTKENIIGVTFVGSRTPSPEMTRYTIVSLTESGDRINLEYKNNSKDVVHKMEHSLAGALGDLNNGSWAVVTPFETEVNNTYEVY